MEKELVELFEAAKKAADNAAVSGVSPGGPELSRCVDALKQLKNFPVTYDILVSTQVGKRLRSLTKHRMEKIRSFASDLLEKWKKLVIDETTGNKKNVTAEESNSKASSGEPVKIESAQKSSVKANPSKPGSSMKSESIVVEKKEISCNDAVMQERSNCAETTIKVEKTIKEEKQNYGLKKPIQTPIPPPKLGSVLKCNDPLRDKFREILAEALSKVAGEADDHGREAVNAHDPFRVAVAVESVLFEKMGRSNGTHKFKYRSIMFNIKDPKNPDFRRKVLLGHVRPERLVEMSPEEMASDERKMENKHIKERALNECERGAAPKATTDQFRCGRCGQRKCTYYQMQTRSADEPMTTYVTCVNCNNHWKFC